VKDMKINIDVKALAKTVTWRMTATTTTILVALFLTGSIEISMSIGSIEMAFKMLLYYIHERLWKQVTIKPQNGE
jgi:uncharacterized membrane protein